MKKSVIFNKFMNFMFSTIILILFCQLRVHLCCEGGEYYKLIGFLICYIIVNNALSIFGWLISKEK